MIAASLERSERSAPFSDFASFAAEEQLPEVPWLTELRLVRPRCDVRCLDRATRITKRALDVVISVTALALMSPVMALVAILVKCTSPGRVIFRQTRVGLNLRRDYEERRRMSLMSLLQRGERRTSPGDRRGQFTYGRQFTMYKFRTMREDAERNGARFAVCGDARVTPVGRFLRKTRLDELPQLWNVLKGDMSLVGPRPERPEFMEELSEQIPNYLDRLGLQPGLTGVAQIVNGYDNELESFRRKVAFDLLYLQNCCPHNDLKIMFRTVGVIVSGQGV